MLTRLRARLAGVVDVDAAAGARVREPLRAAVGRDVAEPPATGPDLVRWSDRAHCSSTIHVEDRDKRRVDKGDGRVSPSDTSSSRSGCRPLPPGRYRVVWSVIARDGHPREGSFSFLLK